MKYIFTKALLEDGWQDTVCMEIGPDGRISQIDAACDPSQRDGAQTVAGFALPGLNNIHSHAFQRAMAGLAEFSSEKQDNFWSWRTLMYSFAARITPEDLYHIARRLYVEMLSHGYCSVAEFHYLHHVVAMENPPLATEMSEAIILAAKDCGIALCLLPVLYMSSGFGGVAPGEQQIRFTHTRDQFAALLDHLYEQLKGHKDQHLGLALHSLRAVPPEDITAAVEHITALDKNAPIHIHSAEQQKEVEDCLAWSGRRPVQWLLDNQDIDPRWCLIHATHMTPDESRAVADSGAVAGLCPTTEANLGDGLFALKDTLDQGGHIAIGSDSQMCTNPFEEIRLLEYGQRLGAQRRTISASEQHPHTGERLYRSCLAGGARASGFNNGALKVGMRADLIILDHTSPMLAGTPDKYLLDRLIFCGSENLVRHVMVGGKWVIEQARHPRQEEINRNFIKTSEKLQHPLN